MVELHQQRYSLFTSLAVKTQCVCTFSPFIIQPETITRSSNVCLFMANDFNVASPPLPRAFCVFTYAMVFISEFHVYFIFQIRINEVNVLKAMKWKEVHFYQQTHADVQTHTHTSFFCCGISGKKYVRCLLKNIIFSIPGKLREFSRVFPTNLFCNFKRFFSAKFNIK